MKARPITRNDLAALGEFWERNGRPGGVNAASWERRWEHNRRMSQGSEPLPIGWVLETDLQTIMGHLGNVALLYDFRGRGLQAAAAADWHVQTGHRACSLLLLNRFFSQMQADLFINSFPADVAISAWTAFGARKVPSPQADEPLFRIVDYARFGQGMFRRKGLPMAALLGGCAGLALRVQDLLGGTRGGVGLPPGGVVRRVGGFDDRFDLFWSRLRQEADRLLLIRERRFLEWYFHDFLKADRGWILVCEKDAELLGYAVFVHKDRKEIGLRRAWVADIQATGEDHPAVLGALLRAGLNECRLEGIHVLEAIGFMAEKREVLRPVLSRHRKFPNWPFVYRARDKELTETLDSPACWDVCVMDGADSL